MSITSDAMALASLVLLAGCVRADAGFGDARVELEERLPIVPSLERSVAAGETSREVRALIRRPLTPEAAVRVALLNQPAVQAALHRIGIARAEVLTAALFPNPRADGELYFPLDGSEAKFEGALLLDLGTMARIPLARSAAELELRAGSLEAAGRILDIAYATRVAFFRYLADRAIRDELAVAVDAMRASWEAAATLRDAGNVRALDEVQERVLYEESRLALARAELVLLDDREELNVRMGLFGPGTAWTVADEMPDTAPPPAEEETFEARAIEASLDLAVLDARRRAAGRRIGLARSLGAMPEARAGFAANREDDVWGLGVAAEVELPVLSQNQGRAAAERSRLGVLDADYAGLAVRVRATLRRARNQMGNAHARVLFYEETLLPLRAELLEQTLRQYNAMTVNVFQLIAARRAQIDARIEYVRARGEYWIARAAFEQLLGGRMVELPHAEGPALSREDARGAEDEEP